MTKKYPKNICLRLEGELIQSVDNYRRGLGDLPGRSEAIRRLIATGLENAKHAA